MSHGLVCADTHAEARGTEFLLNAFQVFDEVAVCNIGANQEPWGITGAATCAIQRHYVRVEERLPYSHLAYECFTRSSFRKYFDGHSSRVPGALVHVREEAHAYFFLAIDFKPMVRVC